MTLRILHVTFDMAIGGTEQVIRQLVENLPKQEFECSIYCIDGKIGALGELLATQGVPVICGAQRESGLDRTLIKNLRALIKSQNIDIVHCHQYTPYVYGLFAALGLKVKVVFTEHGRFYPDSYKWKRMLINPVLSLFTDEIIAISRATADALAKYENFPRKRVGVIYNGMRVTEEPTERALSGLRKAHLIDEGAFIFGTISRLDPIKNQVMMIRSFSYVLPRFPNCILMIVGDGPEREKLEKLSNDLEISEHVRFTGFVTEPQHYFCLFDAFILSSFSEGTSMTLLEAMARSKPCIATAVGGNVEILTDQVNGLLIESDAEQELTQAMVKVLQNPHQAKQLGTQARSTYQKDFCQETMIRHYSDLYRKRP